MLIVFAENENRDPYIDPQTGDLAVLSGSAAVAQLCKSRVEAQRGEMKYATDEGMPDFATAFDTFNPAQFEAACRTILTGTTGVNTVESFSMYQGGNTLYYTAVMTNIYDDQPVTITGVANS